MPVQTVVLLFEGLMRVHLDKDVGMIPVYLKNACGVDVRILCLEIPGEKLPADYRGVPIHQVREWHLPFGKLPVIRKLKKIPLVSRLMSLAKKTDMLMQFHLSERSYRYASVYRSKNKKGGLYLKLDMGMKALEEARSLPEGEEKKRLKKFLQMCDLISVETKAVRDEISPALLGVDIRDKLVYLPNGIDAVGIRKIFPGFRTPDRKEKLAVVVGGIGEQAKDHGLLLEALSGMDMNGWKLEMIGPVREDFRGTIDSFFARNPGLRENVVFTGPITDRKNLYDHYDRASVMVLTSKWESSGMVLTEAMAFGNFILTTDTGAARDVTDNGKWGRIIPVGDRARLKRELADIFSGKTDTSVVYAGILERANRYFLWENLVRELYRKILATIR